MIDFLQLEIHLKALDNTKLPEYHGSMIRGVLGRSIRKVSCTSMNTECTDCAKNNDCPYTKIFYGINSDSDSILSKVNTIPNPFVIFPLMNGVT